MGTLSGFGELAPLGGRLGPSGIWTRWRGGPVRGTGPVGIGPGWGRLFLQKVPSVVGIPCIGTGTRGSALCYVASRVGPLARAGYVGGSGIDFEPTWGPSSCREGGMDPGGFHRRPGWGLLPLGDHMCIRTRCGFWVSLALWYLCHRIVQRIVRTVCTRVAPLLDPAVTI